MNQVKKWFGLCVSAAVATAALGCNVTSDGDDEPVLYKWSCNCGGACAETEQVAFSAAQCAIQAWCEPTGETCVCPGGASSCELD